MVLWLLWCAEATPIEQTELTPQQIELVREKKRMLLGCMQGGRTHWINERMIPVFHNNWVTVDNFPNMYIHIQFHRPKNESAADYAHKQGYANMEATKYIRPDIVYDLENPRNLFAPFENSLELVVSEGLPDSLITENLINHAYHALRDGGWLIFLGVQPEKLEPPIKMQGFEKIDLRNQLWYYPELTAIFQDLAAFGDDIPEYVYKKKMSGGYRGIKKRPA